MRTLLGFYTDEDGKVRPITKSKGTRKAKKNVRKMRLTAEQAALASQVMQTRSPRAIQMDMKRLAKIAPSFEAWLKTPNRYDLPDIDTPDIKAQAKAIKQVLEIESEPVIVITDSQQQPKAEFQIKPKQDVEEKRKGRTPDREAILAKAIELYQKDMALKGLPAITPEEQELKESGYWEQARDLLMYGEQRIVDAQVLAYIDSLKAELEPMGYTIVPIERASAN